MALSISVISPETPCDLFAALALSPTLAATRPLATPTLQITSPGSPSRLFPSVSMGMEDEIEYRNLTTGEAKQVSLLLTQHFFPVRYSPKGMMKESIVLAGLLHDVGIRWDRKRRVMGMHLRGIWDEVGRLGSRGGGGFGRFGPMDLYVQGSFVTIAEEPHPLDPMPIPIDIHPGNFTHLPKLTLQAGLATSLPAILPPLDPESLKTLGDGGCDQPAFGIDGGRGDDAWSGDTSRPGGKVGRSWRERKRVGLKIKVVKQNPNHPISKTPLSVPLPTHSPFPYTPRNLVSRHLKKKRGGYWSNRFFTTVIPFPTFYSRQRRTFGPPPSSLSQGLRSARRVSVGQGGWEVR